MYLKSVKHVACYLSGGKDSALAALLLKGKGHYITGLFLRNKFQDHDTVEGQRECAHKVGQLLEIPVKEITLDDKDWRTFISPVVTQYSQGSNPSLEVLYNRHILFGGLYDQAINGIGADYVATGHYARTTASDKIDKWTRYQGNRLLKAVDLQADQSYLLSFVAQACLQKAYFPIGDFNSGVVSKILAASKLHSLFEHVEGTREKNSSVSSTNVLDLIQEDLPVTRGRVYELESDQELGSHEGLHLWHMGKEMEIGGETFYVVDKDTETNNIKVVRQPDHPALYYQTFNTSLAHWSFQTPYIFFEKQMMDADFCYSVHQPLIKGTLNVGSSNEYYGNDRIVVSSSQPFRAPISGHVTAFYQGEECIGSAKILHLGPSKYAMNKSNSETSKSDSKKSPVETFFGRIFPPVT